MENFYDKVAKRFGGYAFGTNEPKYFTEYPDGNPEAFFKERLIGVALSTSFALDLGCGDGKFAFEVSNAFGRILGIDTSSELLAIGKQKTDELGIRNVSFELQDASQTTFPDDSFDVAFCRRGPTFYGEYYRLLKPGGYYLEIGIGERDCVDLKKVFGRGQNYGAWDEPRLEKDLAELRRAGFDITVAKSIEYREYYESFAAMDEFLQGVPIFEDYDSLEDRLLLEEYCEQAKNPKGILLPRHRDVYVVRKVT